MSGAELLRELADGELRETHASWVLLTEDRAYKVKKPVTLAFLDYGTRERRRRACREEVRVNRELAGEIYLGVRSLVRDAGGRVRLADEGDPGALEYVVEMRRFDETRTMAAMVAAGTLAVEHVRAVGAALAAFHARAPVAEGEDLAARWRADVREIAALGRADAGEAAALGRADVGETPAFGRADGALDEGWDLTGMARFGVCFLDRHREEILARVRAGRVRDGHGDLRCEHVLVSEPVRIVDRIEFDPRLRRIDVAADLAFLTMDLQALGAAWAVLALIEAYRGAGGDPGSDELLAFHGAQRALVRTKVALLRGERDLARRLWRLAERCCWRARGAVAIVVCGPAASGKSTLAAALAERSGLRVFSSDEVRKRIAGLSPTQRGGRELYSDRRTRATYAQIAREAAGALAGGSGAIVDATCRTRAMRAPLLGLAPALFVRCTASPATVRRWAGERMASAGRISDATPQIAAHQLQTFEDLEEVPSERVLSLDSERPIDERLAAIAAALDDPCFATAPSGDCHCRRETPRGLA